MSSPPAAQSNLIIFEPSYNVIICQRCHYALVPREVVSHLRSSHQKEEGLSHQEIKAIGEECLGYPSSSPAWIKEMSLPDTTPALPILNLHLDGYCCQLCPKLSPYTCISQHSIVKHLRDMHQWRRPRGRQSIADPKTAAANLHSVVRFPIACQTFFRRNLFIRYFPVLPSRTDTNEVDTAKRKESNAHELSIPEQIKLQLDNKLAALEPLASLSGEQQHFSQVSPWIETTQWSRYLQGKDLSQARMLITPPTAPSSAPNQLPWLPDEPEYHLYLLLESLDRVIEQARSSLLEDRVNIFDQHRVNSFIPHRSHSRPLWHKLKEQTYHIYKKVSISPYGKRMLLLISCHKCPLLDNQYSSVTRKRHIADRPLKPPG